MHANAATKNKETILADASRKTSLAVLKGLTPFMAPYRGRFVLAGIALVVAAASTLAIPYAFRQMIDLGFSSVGTGNSARRWANA